MTPMTTSPKPTPALPPVPPKTAREAALDVLRKRAPVFKGLAKR